MSLIIIINPLPIKTGSDMEQSKLRNKGCTTVNDSISQFQLPSQGSCEEKEGLGTNIYSDKSLLYNCKINM